MRQVRWGPWAGVAGGGGLGATQQGAALRPGPLPQTLLGAFIPPHAQEMRASRTGQRVRATPPRAVSPPASRPHLAGQPRLPVSPPLSCALIL